MIKISILPLKIKINTFAADIIEVSNGQEYMDIKIDGKLVINSEKEFNFTFMKGNLTIINNGYSSSGLSKENVTQIESHLVGYVAGMQAKKNIACNVIVSETKGRPELEE